MGIFGRKAEELRNRADRARAKGRDSTANIYDARANEYQRLEQYSKGHQSTGTDGFDFGDCEHSNLQDLEDAANEYTERS